MPRNSIYRKIHILIALTILYVLAQVVLSVTFLCLTENINHFKHVVFIFRLQNKSLCWLSLYLSKTLWIKCWYCCRQSSWDVVVKPCLASSVWMNYLFVRFSLHLGCMPVSVYPISIATPWKLLALENDEFVTWSCMPEFFLLPSNSALSIRNTELWSWLTQSVYLPVCGLVFCMLFSLWDMVTHEIVLSIQQSRAATWFLCNLYLAMVWQKIVQYNMILSKRGIKTDTWWYGFAK